MPTSPFSIKVLAVVLAAVLLHSCESKEVAPPLTIEGINTDNFPRLDGSTSVQPLQALLACKLLGARYKWHQLLVSDGTWMIQPNYEDIPHSFFAERVKTSQTHQSLINLIDDKADLTLSARTLSPDEKTYAQSKGVTLIETPIALDAFVFLLNASNPVKSLTHQQILDIYRGNITNWKDVGGNNFKINPYVRNANSGSQELLESLVMKGEALPQWPVEMVSSMMQAFSTIRNDQNGICFTVHYYKESIVRNNQGVKGVSINGINPDRNTIASRQYPYTSEVYAVIRSDLDRNSMAYKLYELLRTPEGKAAIRESGYIPN